MAVVKREICLTKSAKETQRLGEILAKNILKNVFKYNPIVLALNGDLGSGKTTFIQGFAKGLGVKQKILSPTFVILKRFEVKKSKRFKNFFHIDCYRLKDQKDLASLGLRDIFKDPGNIIALEWPKRIKRILPKETFVLDFKFLDKEIREVVNNKNLFGC